MRTRTLAALVILVAAAALGAGCLGGDTAGDDGNGATPGTDADTEPVEPTMDDTCPVCGMMPAKHTDWNAQVVYTDGEAVHFDAPKDLYTYVYNPGEYITDDRTLDDVEATYFTEYYTTEHVALADDLYFVTGSDVTGPMGEDLVPVQGRGNADTFAQEHGGTVLNPEEVTPSVVSELKGGMEMEATSSFTPE